MEISSILIEQYLDPMINAPVEELKPLKAPNCEQDVQRFEAILSGEGPYQPKTLDLIMPATEPNAIQNVSQTFLNRVTTIKQTVDDRRGRVNSAMEKMSSDHFNIGDVLRITVDMHMLSIENHLIAKSGDKAGEGIKTLFRNQ
jgi:hypothetical protein